MEDKLKNKQNREIPEVSNLKGNSYDVKVDGKTYHITLKKGGRWVDRSYEGSDSRKIIVKTYNPFYLEAKAAKNISFVIYFSFNDGFSGAIDKCQLSSYRIGGMDMPVYDWYTDKQYNIDAKDFYEKAFRKSFEGKDGALDAKSEEAKSLWFRFLTENTSLEKLVEAYLKAEDNPWAGKPAHAASPRVIRCSKLVPCKSKVLNPLAIYKAEALKKKR